MRIIFDGTVDEWREFMQGTLLPKSLGIQPTRPPVVPVANPPKPTASTQPTLDYTEAKSELLRELDSYRRGKKDFQPKDLADKYKEVMGRATIDRTIADWLSDKNNEVSYEKTTVKSDGKGMARTLYRHTGVVRIPPDKDHGLKTIPPRGANPRPTKQDTETDGGDDDE